MLETQTVWYKPAFGVLGWHIGFWNLVGAYGFTLCGALGPAYGNSGRYYETCLPSLVFTEELFNHAMTSGRWFVKAKCACH